MSTENQQQYIPGVCNIGRTEIRKRQRVGILGMLATAMIWGLMAWMDAAAAWRWWLFPFAMVSALGWLQAAMGFCAAFGLSGVFKLGTDEDKTDTVQQAEFRKQDQRKAWLILVLGAVFGLAVAGGAYWLAQ